MLFDLRGRGRRRTVQAVYLTLALLLGGGLVLFGVGGAGGGGLLDAFNNDETVVSDGTKDRLEQAEANAKLRPTDAATIAALARARYQVAVAGVDQNTGAFSEEGTQELRGAARAWEKYLTLVGDAEPDGSLANLMVQAFAALNDPARAVAAQEIVIESRENPTAPLYLQLAQFAFLANQTRKAELSGQKAIEVATADQKETVKAQFEALKAEANGSSTSTTTSTSTSTSTSTTTTPAATGTTTTSSP